MEKSKCKCYRIETEIRAKHPTSDWNIDEACNEWQERVAELEDTKIKFEPYADENYACTCPTCGRVVCWWCV